MAEEKKVKVKLLRGMAHATEEWRKGMEVEVSPAEAKRLMAKGWAENTSSRRTSKEDS